jgi:mono/diheme cytochrome c family protein
MLRHNYLHSLTFLLTLGLIATLVAAESMHDHPGKHNHHDDPNGHHHHNKGANGEHDGHTHRHAKWESPPTSYASKRSELWTNDDAIARGKALYQTHCELCHGPDGRGTGSAAKGLPHAPADLTHHFHIKPGDGDAYLFWRVSEGGTVEPFRSMQSAMPAFKTVLSEGQRWDVLAYVHEQFHRGFTSETLPKLVTGEGKIIAVVPDTEQVVVDHRAINGFMEAMTMGYKVNPISLLDDVHAGDQVRFTIDTRQHTIVKMEKIQP